MPTPAFILELRKKIGHDLLLLPGVTGVVVNAKREVLLVRTVHGNWWMPVGGCVEPGEEPADCILREIAEETGLDAEIVRLSSVDAMGSVIYSNGDRCSFVTTTFLCRSKDESQVPRVADEESTEVRYFTTDALPEMRPQHRHRVEQALKGELAAHFRQTRL
jgi:8-oxo-dGTP pyrophosphatase MutT (NUDIX family)